MNYRTQDVIVWDGFPHPDPRSRHAEASVRIAPSFWSRLARHVRDARDCAPARALWENWLSPEGVSALASRTALDIDDAFGTRAPRTAGFRRDAGEMPPVAVERLRATIAASLETPLAMCFHTGATSSSRPALYCLVLTNGATLTLRGDLTTLEAEDCFFSRAAVEASEDAVPPGTPAGREDDAFINNLNDLAGAAGLLCMGGAAFQFLQAPAEPVRATGEETAAGTSLRTAVAREMVRRYAAVDDSKQFVLPDGAAAHGADVGCKRVSFLQPQSWGFTAVRPGSRWTGVVGSAASEQSVNGRGNHQTHSPRPVDHLYDRTGSGRRNGNGNGNRISLPSSDAGMNGTTGKLPHSMPRKSASARPTSDRLLPTKQPSENPQNGVARADLSDGTERLERLAAYRAVVALGECRVFGFTDGQPDAATAAPALVLPADLAITAAARLDERLARWTADAEDLRGRLQSAGGAAAEDLRLGLLESRMEAWAAYLTLDASYTAALDAADPDADRLSQAVDSILTRIEAFDEALQLCEPCLAISDETPLLANWRKMLADAYRDTPPWWLERTPALAAPQ